MDSETPISGSASSNTEAPANSHGLSAAEGVTGRLRRARWFAAIGGVLAALSAFGIDRATFELIPPETVNQRVMGSISTTITRSTPRVITQSEALASGLLGACLCGFLGAAGGLAQRSRSSTIFWSSTAAVLGTILGVGLTYALFPLFFWVREHYLEQTEMVASIALHAMIWAPLGAVAGGAFALALGERRLWGKTLAAGLVGAVLGAIAYDLIEAFFFPLARTADPEVETWLIFLTSRLLVCLATTLLVILSLSEPRSAQANFNEPVKSPSLV